MDADRNLTHRTATDDSVWLSKIGPRVSASPVLGGAVPCMSVRRRIANKCSQFREIIFWFFSAAEIMPNRRRRTAQEDIRRGCLPIGNLVRQPACYNRLLCSGTRFSSRSRVALPSPPSSTPNKWFLPIVADYSLKTQSMECTYHSTQMG
jgi:hypothetical protein